jgi:transitional endoplasmic reticulum ATPase
MTVADLLPSGDPGDGHGRQERIKKMIQDALRDEGLAGFGTDDSLLESGSATVKEIARPQKSKHSKGFQQIYGYENVKRQITRHLINPLKCQDSPFFQEPARGVLFYGPPGCGKTLFAECLAEELGFNFQQLAIGQTIGTKWMHETSNNITTAFETARRSRKPTLVFIDEADSMLNHRGDVQHEGKLEEINTLMQELSSNQNGNIIVVLATNHPEKLDQTAIRSGRIDLKIQIPLPDPETRDTLLRRLIVDRCKESSAIGNLDVKHLVNITEGFTVSDIVAMIQNTIHIALERNLIQLNDDLLQEACFETRRSLTEEQIQYYNDLESHIAF